LVPIFVHFLTCPYNVLLSMRSLALRLKSVWCTTIVNVNFLVINEGRVIYSFVDDEFLHDWLFHSIYALAGGIWATIWIIQIMCYWLRLVLLKYFLLEYL
jgi:hypothetical protein